MKKILSMFLGIFVVSFIFLSGNIIFAQDADKSTDSSSTSSSPQDGGNGQASQSSSVEGQTSTSNDAGINFSNGCLTGIGQNCFGYERVIGIEKTQKTRYTALSISQDIIYTATRSVGLVLTAIIIYCGLGYIFAARGGTDVTKYKKGLINAAIGAILVLGAYAIVRLIQYIAKG